jgi:S-(hydroxymethyl)glutathione dehydrogenase / alcohol dehydrogenase
MKAAILREIGSLTIEDVDLDGPNDDEVRIRVLASGLCHSDYHIICGDLPATPRPVVLGHEASGTVTAVGANVRGIKVGDFVATCISAFCGQCRECQQGHNYLCDAPPGAPTDRPNGARISANGAAIHTLMNLGGFAEEMVVHHRAVAKIPEGVPPEAAALLGCAVLTGVGSVLNGAKVEAGATVAVIGCGGVGLNVIQGARIAAASRIIAIDLHQGKLDMARRFGATDTILAGPTAVKQALELTGGGVDYAFEVIGLAATMRDAFGMLRKRGTVVAVGVGKAGADLSVPMLPFVFKEVRIVGTFMGSSPFQLLLPQLARYYLEGVLKLDELVSERIPLTAINDGFRRMIAGEINRSVVVF